MKVSGTVVICKFLTMKGEKFIKDCFFDIPVAKVREIAKQNNFLVVKCIKKTYTKNITVSQLCDNVVNELRNEVMKNV